MMVKAGHDPGRSAGLIAAGGIIGPVIPPSIGFIIFGLKFGICFGVLFIINNAIGLITRSLLRWAPC